MLLVIGYWLIYHNSQFSFQYFKPVYFQKWNVLLFGFITILYPFVSYYIHLNIVTSVLGLSGLYILLSFTIPYINWKNGFIPFTLLVMCLPFGRQLDTYIGFPLRMFSVDFVAYQMKWLGFNLNSRDTILLIENKASQVDIDCSGIKGLWVGIIFFIAYTWINNIKLNLKWFGLLLILIFAILFFNILRVSTLVLLNSISGLEKSVNYFHYSIAAFGIVLSCSLVHFSAIYFKLLNNYKINLHTNVITYLHKSQNYLIGLNLFIMVLFFIPQKPIHKQIKTAIPSLTNSKNLSIQPQKFSAGEKTVFEKDGSAAQKLKFKFKEIEGEAIIIKGNDWRAQHKPELCFEASGNSLQSIKTILVNHSFPVKYILFHKQKAVVYSWFQSPTIITEDYSYRSWLELIGQESNWVLMNIVIYDDTNKLQVIELLEFLKLEIKQSFITTTKLTR
jgi:exosortase O